MTKVEELRKGMIDIVTAAEEEAGHDADGAACEVDTFICAIRAEERERISYNSWGIPMGEAVSQCAETLYDERGILVAGKDLRIIPRSVLAPTKEEP